jgi:hypothetical protein
MLMKPARREVSLAWLCLCVSGWIAASVVFASSDANAFVCLPSAEAVRQQDSAAWPSWTLRAHGFEGTKCWYASTRGAAHDHRTVQSREPASAVINAPPELEPASAAINAPLEPEPVSAVSGKPPEPEVTGSATRFERVGTSMANLDSTFEDRFLAVCPIAGPSIPGCTSPAPPMKRTGKLNFK